MTEQDLSLHLDRETSEFRVAHEYARHIAPGDKSPGRLTHYQK
jgi:hypothetical protein